nr:uncharacterized protein LOC113732084 isoform X3 [Coffea arabica]
MPLRNTFKSGTQDGEVRKQSNFGWHWISYLPTRRQRPPEQIQKKILYGHHLDMAFPSNEEASDYHLTSTEVELAEKLNGSQFTKQGISASDFLLLNHHRPEAACFIRTANESNSVC